MTNTTENKELVRRIPEDVMTRGNEQLIEEVYEPLRAGFSDLDITAEELVAEGDRVVLRATIPGTHDGVFNGIEPTGNTVEVPAMVMHHIADGRITERWVNFDAMGMMQQLGVLEPPAA